MVLVGRRHVDLRLEVSRWKYEGAEYRQRSGVGETELKS